MRELFEKLINDQSDSNRIRFQIVKGNCMNKDDIERKDIVFRLDRLSAKGYKGVYDKDNDSLETLRIELKRVREWRANLRA